MKARKDKEDARAGKQRQLEYSKKLIADIRSLLWVVTVGGIALAFCCVLVGYTGALPWISTMVGLPWAAHGTVCSFYLNMAKSDHKGADGNGITFAIAQAHNFEECENSWQSPEI